jgi:hypothetical protein
MLPLAPPPRLLNYCIRKPIPPPRTIQAAIQLSVTIGGDIGDGGQSKPLHINNTQWRYAGQYYYKNIRTLASGY